jgi:hypothetical protein
MKLEDILAEIEKQLGPLDEKARKAVELAVTMTAPQKEAEGVEWQGENPPFELAAKMSLEERSQLLEALERHNYRWLESQCAKLGAHWLVVVDGQVLAFGGPGLQGLEIDRRIEAVGRQTGKYPLVFIHPMALAVEETPWHPTNVSGDFYPTLPIIIRNGSAQVTLVADFDTGAYGCFADGEWLAQQGLISLQTGERIRRAYHLNMPYAYLVRTLTVALTADSQQREASQDVLCVLNWRQSPFVAINPNRTALVGRDLCLALQPIVTLNFADRTTNLAW